MLSCEIIYNYPITSKVEAAFKCHLHKVHLSEVLFDIKLKEAYMSNCIQTACAVVRGAAEVHRILLQTLAPCATMVCL